MNSVAGDLRNRGTPTGCSKKYTAFIWVNLPGVEVESVLFPHCRLELVALDLVLFNYLHPEEILPFVFSVQVVVCAEHGRSSTCGQTMCARLWHGK